MEMVAIMATIILIATLATLIFAFAAYFATKAKKKKVKQINPAETQVRKFFERYLPNEKAVSGKDVENQTETESQQWT